MTQVRATSRARARELCGGVEREEPEEAVGLVPMVTLSVVGSDRNMDIPRRTSSGSPATPPPLGLPQQTQRDGRRSVWSGWGVGTTALRCTHPSR